MPESNSPFRLPWLSAAEIDADLEAELALHLELRITELVAGGMSEPQAREEALRRFGNLEEARRYCRSLDADRARTARQRDFLQGWRQDLGFAFRQLFRNPAFTIVAVLTLGLGIGANTAIFSVVHKLLLAPLPFANAERIVVLMVSSAKSGFQMTPQDERVQVWRQRAHTLEGIEEFSGGEVTLGGDGEPETISTGYISATMTGLLGISPVMGRSFLPEETRPGGAQVAILGYGLWHRRFSGRTDALGKTLTIDGHDYTIVGVMPRKFDLPFLGTGAAKQLWLPMLPDSQPRNAGTIARLRPGATMEDATGELAAIDRSSNSRPAQAMEFTGQALSPHVFTAASIRVTLLVLFGVVGLVLLIACANVANLLLARATTRSREFAIRSALGAGRGRLIRQLLTESTCLALLGGALGLLLAWKGLDLIIALRPDSLSELDDVTMEPVALAWSLGLSLLTGLLFGLAPSLLTTEKGLNDSLRSGAGAGGHRGSRRLRAGLVVAEVALSVTLLIGAGLLLRTMASMQRIELGFDPHDLASVQITLPRERYAGPAQFEAAYEQVAETIRKIPGVTDVVLTGGVPLQSGIAFGELQLEGRAIPNGQKISVVGFVSAKPGYFSALRLPMLEGRDLDAREGGDEQAVINQAMARKLWPGTSAVGKRYRMGPEGSWVTVVGVVADVRVPGRMDDVFFLQSYFRYTANRRDATVLIRTQPGTTGIVLLVRSRIAALDPLIRVPHVNTMESLLASAIAGPRFTTTLFGTFALLALVLSTIGLYGVIAYSVTQRTREIGVRIALGAGARSVIQLVVGQGLRLTLVGVALGLAAAVAATRLMQSMLYGVDPLDPITFGLVALLLTGVAVAAAYFPARRASRVDPVLALRSE